MRAHGVEPSEEVPSWRLIKVELDGVSPGSAVTLEIGYTPKGVPPALPGWQ